MSPGKNGLLERSSSRESQYEQRNLHWVGFSVQCFSRCSFEGDTSLIATSLKLVHTILVNWFYLSKELQGTYPLCSKREMIGPINWRWNHSSLAIGIFSIKESHFRWAIKYYLNTIRLDSDKTVRMVSLTSYTVAIQPNSTSQKVLTSVRWKTFLVLVIEICVLSTMQLASETHESWDWRDCKEGELFVGLMMWMSKYQWTVVDEEDCSTCRTYFRAVKICILFVG